MPNPPKPTVLKIVQGTDRPDRVNPNEPKPTGTLSEPPEWFNEKQRYHWDYVREWAPPGLLAKIDVSALTGYCVACAAYEEATKLIERTGIIIKGSTGSAILNPAVRAQNAAFGAMMKAASEMGFTPSSRTRVSVNPEGAEEDPWSKLANES